MKAIKYAVLVGLLCTSSAFAHNSMTVVNSTDKCIWLTPGGDLSDIQKPDYPFAPHSVSPISSNLLLGGRTQCSDSSTCNSYIQYSAYAKDSHGDYHCEYLPTNLHRLNSTATWSGISNHGASYSQLTVSNQDSGVSFKPVGSTLGIFGNP